jgi:hypothetical protein
MNKDLLDKHLNVGVYDATDAFRAIEKHSCVCFDDMGLVAVTGQAKDEESKRYADLFAASPEMYTMLRSAQNLLQRCKRIIEQSSAIPSLIEGDIETLYWKIDDMLEERHLSDYKFIAAKGEQS